MARQRKRGINGAGSVFQRKDGRWEAKFKVEETGKYKSLYAATEKEAYQKLQEAFSQQKQGILATGPQQTIKQFLLYWLEDVQKPTVQLSTYIGNRVLVQKHLIAGLGHHKVQKLTAQQVQSFYAKKLKEGTSANRIKQMHSVLHKALTHAKAIKLVGVNVTDEITLPTRKKYEAPVISPEQARLLLQKAKERNLNTLLAVAIGTGMRMGEILSLRWADLDMEKGTLQVARTVTYLPVYHFVEGGPKTKSSKRFIVLPQFLIDLLKDHRASQAVQREVRGVSWVDRDLIFPNKTGGFLLHTTLRRQFYRLLNVLEFPEMHFHDLRHSAATILLSMGVPAHMVQELLGHSDIKVTLGIYGSVVPSMRKDVADKMDGLFLHDSVSNVVSNGQK